MNKLYLSDLVKEFGFPVLKRMWPIANNFFMRRRYSVALRKTYKIEMWIPGSDAWKTVPLWEALPMGRAEGAMMAIDALYGQVVKYRMVCEQTQKVTREAGGRSLPTTD